MLYLSTLKFQGSHPITLKREIICFHNLKTYLSGRHPTFDIRHVLLSAWWRHQMDTYSAWLAICAGNSPVPGEFPAQRPVTQSFDVFFDLRLNKRLSKQSWGWWFETLSCPLWRHCNGAISPILSFTWVLWLYRCNRIWWLWLVPTSTTRFASDLWCRMAKKK